MTLILNLEFSEHPNLGKMKIFSGENYLIIFHICEIIIFFKFCFFFLI